MTSNTPRLKWGIGDDGFYHAVRVEQILANAPDPTAALCGVAVRDELADDPPDPVLLHFFCLAAIGEYMPDNRRLGG
jgi:hypothetical protein